MPADFSKLGQFIGSGGRMGNAEAEIAGQQAGLKARYTSAQTEEAIERAKNEQLKARKAQREQDADDQFADSLVIAGVAKDRNHALALANIGRAGYAKYDDLVTGRGKLQEQGFQATLADELAPPEKQLAAAQGLKKEIQSPFVSVPGEFVDIRKPDAGVQASPNMASQITDRNERRTNPQKFRNEKTPEQIKAEAEARTLGTGQAKRTLDLPQAQARFETFNAKQDEISSRALELGSNDNLWKAVGGARTLAEIPGTEGATIRAKVKTLVAKLAVQAVQEARDLSKTGGAYGNTNAREWEDIGQSAAAINDSMAPSAAREELLALADRVELAKQRSTKAFYATYPELKQGGGTQLPAQTSKPKTVTQNGYTYTLNEATGEYE